MGVNCTPSNRTYVKSTVPQMLQEFNLHVNNSKTEQYTITSKDKEWHTCKLLGSHIDTKTDITRRKSLTLATMKKHRKIYSSKHLSSCTKIRHFRAFEESTFLYGCENWAITKTMAAGIDAFHRRLLRYSLGVTYPKIMKNKKLYDLTKVEPWSKTIKRRRLNWLGHLMRLDPETPARQALQESLRSGSRRRVGNPGTTWLGMIKDDLKTVNISLNLSNPDRTIKQLILLTENRDNWHTTTKRVMLGIPASSEDVKLCWRDILTN